MPRDLMSPGKLQRGSMCVSKYAILFLLLTACGKTENSNRSGDVTFVDYFECQRHPAGDVNFDYKLTIEDYNIISSVLFSEMNYSCKSVLDVDGDGLFIQHLDADELWRIVRE
jgi:hypothetical protein